MTFGKMQIDGRGLEVGMPEQRLHGRQIRSPFHQMCREAVAPMPHAAYQALCREDQNNRLKAFGNTGVLARQPFFMRHSPESRDQSCLRKASNSSSG